MDQEKIGRFIAKCRKDKKLTQTELATKIGVSEKSISNWENGRNMPDLSLFKPLCDELDISINELLSGERLKKEVYQEKCDENILNTITYTNKKVNEKVKNIGLLLVIFGLFISFMSMSIFPSESSWGLLYSILGGIISLIGVSKLTKKLSYKKRVLCNYVYFLFFMLILILIDYIGVVTFNQVPRFSYSVKTVNNMMVYNAPFCNVYRINYNTKNEYYIVDTKKEYTSETVPNVPFNRNKSGIDNIIKYQNKYLGNNSNTGNLINSLPLSEYGYVFEIDSKNLGLTINYHITDWYINENNYLEKSLIYNSVSIFLLIDNVEYINFNFSGVTYNIERNQIEKIFPNYSYITKDGINKDNFNQYLENFITTNEDSLLHIFKNLFLDEAISETTKIIVKNNADEVINTITNEEEIAEIITLISRATKITGVINLDGAWWNIYMYNEDSLLQSFVGWGYNGYSSCFGFDEKEYKLIGLDGERFSQLIKG